MRVSLVPTLLAWIALSALGVARNENQPDASSAVRQSALNRQTARQVEMDRLVAERIEALTTELELRLDQRDPVRQLLDAEVRHEYARQQHADKVTLSSSRVLPPTVKGAPKRKAGAARKPVAKEPAEQKRPAPAKPGAKTAAPRRPAGSSSPDASPAAAPSTDFLAETRTTTLDDLFHCLDDSQRERFSTMLGAEGRRRLEQLSNQRKAAWRSVGYGKQLVQPKIQRKAPRSHAQSHGRAAQKNNNGRNNRSRRIVRKNSGNGGNDDGGSSGGSHGGDASGGGNTRGGGGSSGGKTVVRPPKYGKSASGRKPPR